MLQLFFCISLLLRQGESFGFHSCYLQEETAMGTTAAYAVPCKTSLWHEKKDLEDFFTAFQMILHTQVKENHLSY